MRQMPINDNRLQHADTMIITCQNCRTNYDIDAAALGGGKTVSCHNCGNTWHQNPVQAPPPVTYTQPAYPQQVPFDAAPPPAPVAEPQAAPAPEPIPEPVPEPEPEPIPEPEPASEIEADAVARAEAALMAEEEEAAGDDAEDDFEPFADDAEDGAGGDDALSTAQLDEMFGEEIDQAVFSDEDAGDAPAGASEDDGEPEDIVDPDPIPEVFSAGDDDDLDADVKKGGKGKIIGIAAAVLFIIALGGGLFFGKSFIIDLYPPATDIYAMINLGGEELGEGLEINNVESTRNVEKGVDVLVIKGEIANVSDKERMVPMIRVVLFDSAGEEIQSAVAAPLKNRLPGGATIAFGAKLPEPSALARRLEVTFSAPEK